MRVRSLLSCFVALLAIGGASRIAVAQVLYTENFNDGNASSRWTTSPSGNPNYAINYAYDYVAAGIPLAPSGTSSTGLWMKANTTGSQVGSVMAFPTGQNFSGNQTLSFDLWFGVSGSVATTEFGIFGLMHTSTSSQVPTNTTGTTPSIGPSPNGVDYALTGDTGASRDVRVYVSGTEQVGNAGGYARNTTLIQEQQNAPYNFAYYPFLTSTNAMAANQWLKVAVTAYSGTTLFQVNGQTWARMANTTGTGNIMLGYMDIFTSVSGTGMFGLYDNVQVSVAQAPATQLVWSPSGTVAGGNGTWSNLGTQWVASGTTPTTWDWSLPAKFQGTAGTVTIPTQVTSGAGLEFLSSGYVVTSGTIIMGSFDPLNGGSFNSNAISTITVAPAATARIESFIRGIRGITKLGEGTLVLTNVNPVSGTSVVQSGTLVLGNQQALGSSPVSVVPGGTLKIDPALGMIGPRLILNGGTVAAAGATLTVDRDLGVRQLIVNSGSLAGSPNLAVTLGGTMIMSGTAVTSVSVSSLVVDETITATGTGGLIDLGVGRINIAAGGITPAALVADIVAGSSGTAGSWTGITGITSSVAAAATSSPRAVGWIDAGVDGLAVAFAAPGDTNLDGLVDVLDAAALSSAARFNDTAVWSEGDFNYDGVYDDLDNALFIATGLFDADSYLPAPAGSAVAVVPEPSSLVAAGVTCLAVAWRSSRRRRGLRPGAGS